MRSAKQKVSSLFGRSRHCLLFNDAPPLKRRPDFHRMRTLSAQGSTSLGIHKRNCDSEDVKVVTFVLKQREYFVYLSEFSFFLAKQSLNHRCGKKYSFLYVKLNNDIRTGLASRDDKNE